MSPRHVVVDGSNIATEGRSLPSLAQLDQAVREFIAENPQDVVTVVVDASFGHRVDPSELPMFEGAEAAGEIVSPPAGAIGRGDAFLLRIAEKIGATVLSNDSFQEFHVEHQWLFDKGRLIGGKPVPGVGWIFMDRTPVRGQKSREVTKEAKRKRKAETSGTGGGLEAVATKGKPRDKKVDRAIARATEEAVKPVDEKRSRRRRAGAPPAEPVNEPLPFITFIAAHPLGTEVTGVVAEFASHGAFVDSFDTRCYVPLSAMGNPPPRRAREVVSKGEERTFVVQAFDPPRRGIELAIPGFEQVAGTPTEETVEAEIHPHPERKPRKAQGAKAAAARKAARKEGVTEAGVTEPGPKKAAPEKTAAKKAAAKKSPDKKVPAKKGPAKKVPAETNPAKKAAATKAASKKEPAKKAPAKKAVGAEKTPAKKTPAKKATAKEAPVKKAAPAKAAPEGVAAPPRKTPAKKVSAEKTPSKKAAGKKAAAVKRAAPTAEKSAPPRGAT